MMASVGESMENAILYLRQANGCTPVMFTKDDKKFFNEASKILECLKAKANGTYYKSSWNRLKN